jgi:hypothetical protein
MTSRAQKNGRKLKSDKDTGYLWGKGGQQKAKKESTKKGYLWKGEK